MMPYPIAIGGQPIVFQLHSNIEKDSINEKGLVAKTSA